MSLHQLANHMSAQGRGPDSTLVHMSPREVSGLQSLAMANGGTLTINPQTGLPEAGFLDSILPTLLGGAATFFSGGTITPFMAALGVGGLTALTSKDLGKGLMAGLGAYGGGSIVSGLAGFGTGAMSAEAGGAAVQAAGVNPLGLEADILSQSAIAPKLANASYYDKIAAGASKAMTNPGDALSALGGGSKLQGAAMIGAPLLSALSTQDQTSVPTFEQVKFDPRDANINIRRDQLPYQPDTGSSAQRGYFGPTYVGADGGFVSDNGIEHFAAGGIPLDPDYDYSGYGRKKTDAVRPVTPMPNMPRPDFVGADGKTYRYDPIKKNYYVIKEAETKTNPGVETLMGGAGMGGNVDTPSQFDNPGGVRTTPEMSLPVAYAAGTVSNAFLGPRQGPAAPVEDRIADRQTMAEIVDILNGLTTTGTDISGGQFAGATSPSTNTGATGMNTGTTGGTPSQAGDISNPGGPANSNTLGGDVTSSTPDGPSGTDFSGADTAGTGFAGDVFAYGGMTGYAQGGLGSLGGYSDGGRLLRGPGDGVSDSIPATVGDRQPARLADGEFVVPARIVSELGNGSTEAGARALYKMMDRIQANRRKTTGKNSVAVNSKSHKYLPA